MYSIVMLNNRDWRRVWVTLYILVPRAFAVSPQLGEVDRRVTSVVLLPHFATGLDERLETLHVTFGGRLVHWGDAVVVWPVV